MNFFIKKMRGFLYNRLMHHRTGNYLFTKYRNLLFPGSKAYWERRYNRNGNSGIGSYGENALYKANVVNHFVENNKIKNVIEFGCGDGNQLKQFHFPKYIGFDVSPTAVKLCKEIFKKDHSKQFFLLTEKNVHQTIAEFNAELSLSLDVIYHLIEDEIYEKYMQCLFSASSQYVIIYAWDVEEKKNYHVRHRKFTKWIESNVTDFQLIERVSENSFCDFFIYSRNTCQNFQ